MSGSNKKNRPWVIDLILVLLIIGLGYVVYTMIWGDWYGLINRLGYTGDSDIFGGVLESMSAFGRGLRDSFGDMLP